MWRCYDTPAETAGVLRRKVRYMDVRAEQALPSHGETAQPGAGRSRTGLRETGSEPRRGIYVPRTGARFGSYYRDIRYGAEQL